jgi:hypothetical protein
VNGGGADMAVKHILTNGEVVDDISGFVVTGEPAGRIVGLIKQIQGGTTDEQEEKKES